MTIAPRIHQIIAEHFARELPELAKRPELDGGTHLAADLGADSIDIVELVMAVESEFDIDIQDERLAGIQTVQHLVDIAASLTLEGWNPEQDAAFGHFARRFVEHS